MARAVEKPDDQEIHYLILFFFSFFLIAFSFYFLHFLLFFSFLFFLLLSTSSPLTCSVSPPPHSFTLSHTLVFILKPFPLHFPLLFTILLLPLQALFYSLLSLFFPFIHSFFFFTTISFFLSILLYASTFLTPFLFNCLSFRLVQIFSVTYNLRAVLHLQHIQYLVYIFFCYILINFIKTHSYNFPNVLCCFYFL